MYGIVEIGGHQFKVKAGDVIDVQKLTNEANSNVEFDKVLFVGGEKPAIGNPAVSGAKVTAQVIKHDRSRKMIIFVRKPGKYQKKNGHRQPYTSLLITEVSNGQGDTAKIDPESRNAKKYLK